MSHGSISLCPCKVFCSSEVLWVLWPLSPDRCRERGRERGKWRHLTLLPQKEMTACDGYLAANLRVNEQDGGVPIVQTGSTTKNTNAQGHTRHGCKCTPHALLWANALYTYRHTQMSNGDSGIVWVTITQGEMLRLPKCVWVIAPQSTLYNIQG